MSCTKYRTVKTYFFVYILNIHEYLIKYCLEALFVYFYHIFILWVDCDGKGSTVLVHIFYFRTAVLYVIPTDVSTIHKFFSQRHPLLFTTYIYRTHKRSQRWKKLKVALSRNYKSTFLRIEVNLNQTVPRSLCYSSQFVH